MHGVKTSVTESNGKTPVTLLHIYNLDSEVLGENDKITPTNNEVDSGYTELPDKNDSPGELSEPTSR